jgi:hypothetical protein
MVNIVVKPIIATLWLYGTLSLRLYNRKSLKTIQKAQKIQFSGINLTHRKVFFKNLLGQIKQNCKYAVNFLEHIGNS